MTVIYGIGKPIFAINKKAKGKKQKKKSLN